MEAEKPDTKHDCNVNQPSHCIAIGDCAVTTTPFEIVIRVTGYEGRTIMTQEEFDVISSVIKRMDFYEIPLGHA